MAFPTLRTWVDNEVSRAAYFNTDIRDAEEFLKGQAGTITWEDSAVITGQTYTVLQTLMLRPVNTTQTSMQLIHELRNDASTAIKAFVLDSTWLDDTAGFESPSTGVFSYIGGAQINTVKLLKGLVVPDASGDPTGGDIGRGGLNARGLRCELGRAYGPTVGAAVELLETANSATTDDIIVETRQYDLLTTGTGLTTLASIATNTDETITVEATVVGRVTGGISGTVGDGISGHLVGTFANISDALAQIGSDTYIYYVEDVATFHIDVGFSGANIRVQVQGAFQHDISWHGTCRIYRISS